LGDGVVFQSKTLRELSLAAGLWLTASACLAAPQPGQAMKLGGSAMPPPAYLAFCERQPQDCGDDARVVLAGAARATAERAALLAELSPAQMQIATPAAVSMPAQPALIKAAWTPPMPAESLLPAPEVLSAVVERAEPLTRVDFVDPAAEARVTDRNGPPAMTPELWSRLNSVNARVNGAIVQRTDMETYGQADYWTTPLEDGQRYGDCEDYVLEKQRALIAAGVPRRAVNIALVTTPWGESHAVLLVSTGDGDYVLDNLNRWVIPWQRTAYRWRERQVDGDPFTWAMIEDPSRRPAPPMARPDARSERLLIASLR
jgi:predicted transglutaminase-like cysteine proteinase